MSERRTITIGPTDLVIATAGTRDALHAAVTRLYELAKERAALAGDRLDADSGEVVPRSWRLLFIEAEDDRTLLQNSWYWAAVLRQISEQAAPGGQRWSADAWHQLLKRQFLGYEMVRERIAGRKRMTVYRRLKSTTRLTVKPMSEYLEKVIAFATTELGVVFVFDEQEREACRYQRPARRAKRRSEAVEA